MRGSPCPYQHLVTSGSLDGSQGLAMNHHTGPPKANDDLRRSTVDGLTSRHWVDPHPLVRRNRYPGNVVGYLPVRGSLTLETRLCTSHVLVLSTLRPRTVQWSTYITRRRSDPDPVINREGLYGVLHVWIETGKDVGKGSGVTLTNRCHLVLGGERLH